MGKDFTCLKCQGKIQIGPSDVFGKMKNSKNATTVNVEGPLTVTTRPFLSCDGKPLKST